MRTHNRVRTGLWTLLLVAVLGAGPAAVQAARAQAGGSQPPVEESAPRGWVETQLSRFGAWLGETWSRYAPARHSAGAAPAGRPPAAPIVTASRPVSRPIIEWDEYTGRFEAVETVEIRARVSGYLDRVAFKDGQVVEAGDLLYTIDPRPFERALATARAELDLARTRATNAAKDVERGRPLVEKRIMSEKGFDDRENLLKEAEAAVKVAEARVQAAQLDLAFTRISAPIGGRIGLSSITAGNYISAGGSNNATVLTTIVRQHPIYVYFDVSENNTLKYKRLVQSGEHAGAMAAGVAIEVALPDEAGYPHRGFLDFSDNRLDPGTGTLRARARLDNERGLFSPGMFARVRLAGSASHTALLVPDEAIGTDQASKFVYVVGEDGIAQRRAVLLGPMVDGLRVVRQGIAAADWIIVKGVQRARPGQKVAPQREELQVSAVPPLKKAVEQ